MSIFNQVQLQKLPSSTFDLSHQYKTAGFIGKLIPVMNIEAIPGDVFSGQTACLLRMAPMIAPIMHQVTVNFYSFYVPYRILWDGFEDFIRGGEDGMDVSVPPTIDVSTLTYQENDLPDYLGIKPNVPDETAIEGLVAYDFAAYQAIHNEFFRDQNLHPEVNFKLSDGDNTSRAADFLTLRNKAHGHDYFTSALPFTQKGPAVTIPIGTEAPIIMDPARGNTFLIDNATGASYNPGVVANLETTTIGNIRSGLAPNPQLDINVAPNHYADLSAATANTIVDLRNAFRLQEWYERNARSGSRYPEFIKAHYDTNVGDARVDRPEYLGGGKLPVRFSEVLQTSASNLTGGATPQGNMAGHGITADQATQWRYHVKEHGVIMTLMSVCPKTAYQDGIHRSFYKKDRFDHYFNTFAHIGEQPIFNREVFINNNNTENEAVFGYTPRYAEYKFQNDRVSGAFRTSLDFWQGGRKFSTRPVLNAEFVECRQEEYTRLFANSTGEQFYAHVYHSIRARRKMPYFANPKI